MPEMTPMRSLFYPVLAWTELVGDGPAPFGAVVSAYLQNFTNTVLINQVSQIRLGVWVNDDPQRIQELQLPFWNQLKVRVQDLEGFDPTPLGDPPTLAPATEFGELSSLVYSLYHVVGNVPPGAAPASRDVKHLPSVKDVDAGRIRDVEG